MVGKKLYISKQVSNGRTNSIMTIQDNNGQNLNFINLDTGIEISQISHGVNKMNILVPEEAVRITFSPRYNGDNMYIYEVQVVE